MNNRAIRSRSKTTSAPIPGALEVKVRNNPPQLQLEPYLQPAVYTSYKPEALNHPIPPRTVSGRLNAGTLKLCRIEAWTALASSVISFRLGASLSGWFNGFGLAVGSEFCLT